MSRRDGVEGAPASGKVTFTPLLPVPAGLCLAAWYPWGTHKGVSNDCTVVHSGQFSVPGSSLFSV